jgi:transposase-like protein
MTFPQIGANGVRLQELPVLIFNSSPVIRLVRMMYVKYPLSLPNVEDLLTERRIGMSQETVRGFGEAIWSDGRGQRDAWLHTAALAS